MKTIISIIAGFALGVASAVGWLAWYLRGVGWMK